MGDPGGERGDHPPPPELVLILKTYAECAGQGRSPPWNVQGGCLSIFRRADDVTRAMSKGGACECPRGYVLVNFLGRMTSHAGNVQGGVLVNAPPPPFRKFCIGACTWMGGFSYEVYAKVVSVTKASVIRQTGVCPPLRNYMPPRVLCKWI